MISGLGADRNMFSGIKIPDYSIRYIEWVKPAPYDDIQTYSQKLIKQIDTKKSCVLIGVSFGGIIAQEISKIIKPVNTIIISSIVARNELPALYRIAGRIKLHKTIPTSFLLKFNRIANFMFGAKSLMSKNLLKQTLLETDKYFLKWAIEQILHYEFDFNDLVLTRIHGDKDKILPIKSKKNHNLIKGGGHLIIVTNALEINIIISKALSLKKTF